MRLYKVVITDAAKQRLKLYLSYIRNVLQNPQAARAVREDAKETKKKLATVADTLKYMDNPQLSMYKKIYFLRHDYVMIFRIVDNVVFVEWIYHELQNYTTFIS